MQFNDYSIKAISTLTDKESHHYGDVDARLMSQVLGLSGEAGEVMEKFKKILRDKNGKISILKIFSTSINSLKFSIFS